MRCLAYSIVISTHAPTEGSDRTYKKEINVFTDISTHAPTEGSDAKGKEWQEIRRKISTHAPTEGSDPTVHFV